jgi:dTDP-4-amino-4,6-dideoxygalactose transaminase
LPWVFGCLSIALNGAGTPIPSLPAHDGCRRQPDRQECFAYLGYREGQFPESERACREVLSLPVFPELTQAQLSYVAETVGAFFGREKTVR